MRIPRFLQLHTLHDYTGVQINRDNNGLSKRLRFGGTPRTRISSQCLKYHMRHYDGETSFLMIDGLSETLRSRNFVENAVMEAIRSEGPASEEVINAVEQQFRMGIYGEKATADRNSRQVVTLSQPEVQYLTQKARDICLAHPNDPAAAEKAGLALFSKNGEADNFRAFRKSIAMPGGITSAMFGRMVTSDTSANIDSAVHVAHSITVHRQEQETDYLVAMEDIQRDEGESEGAAHLSSVELNSGIFYGYIVVDAPQLVSNIVGVSPKEWLEADRTVPAMVIKSLVDIVCKVSPGARKGSTAPYSYADFIMIEAGPRQPRSLASAFRADCPPQTPIALARLKEKLAKIDEGYGVGETRQYWSAENIDIKSATRTDVIQLAEWASDVIQKGEVEE